MFYRDVLRIMAQGKKLRVGSWEEGNERDSSQIRETNVHSIDDLMRKVAGFHSLLNSVKLRQISE